MLALFVMTVASSLVVAIVDSQLLRHAALRNTRDWDRARYLAESGLNHAFAELEKNIEFRTEIAWTEFPVGSGDRFMATLQDGPKGTVVIQSVGSAGSFNRYLSVTIKQGG